MDELSAGPATRGLFEPHSNKRLDFNSLKKKKGGVKHTTSLTADLWVSRGS